MCKIFLKQNIQSTFHITKILIIYNYSQKTFLLTRTQIKLEPSYTIIKMVQAINFIVALYIWATKMAPNAFPEFSSSYRKNNAKVAFVEHCDLSKS